MIGWIVPLLSRRKAADVVRPGGTFRRTPPTWHRTTVRKKATWERDISRTVATWPRTWRYKSVPTIPTEGEILIAAVSDDREYAFDFQAAPELKTLAMTSAVVIGGTGLDKGIPAISTEDFDKVPAGKGVIVRISGGEAGTIYPLACIATLSNGRKLTVPGRLSKVADYGS